MKALILVGGYGTSMKSNTQKKKILSIYIIFITFLSPLNRIETTHIISTKTVG